jgi:hypothetical protein
VPPCARARAPRLIGVRFHTCRSARSPSPPQTSRPRSVVKRARVETIRLQSIECKCSFPDETYCFSASPDACNSNCSQQQRVHAWIVANATQQPPPTLTAAAAEAVGEERKRSGWNLLHFCIAIVGPSVDPAHQNVAAQFRRRRISTNIYNQVRALKCPFLSFIYKYGPSRWTV